MLTLIVGVDRGAVHHRCWRRHRHLLPLLRARWDWGDEHQEHDIITTIKATITSPPQAFTRSKFAPSPPWWRIAQTLLERMHMEMERVQMMASDSVDSVVENSFGGNRRLALMVKSRSLVCQNHWLSISMKAVIGMLVTIAVSVAVAIYFLCFESEEQVTNRESADVTIMITITIMIIHNMNSIIAHIRIKTASQQSHLFYIVSSPPWWRNIQTLLERMKMFTSDSIDTVVENFGSD